AFEVFERFARRDPIDPRAEQLGVAQPADFAIDENEDLLQDVFGRRARADEAENVTIERLLQHPEETVERLAVSGLSAQREPGLLFAAFHLRPPLVKRRDRSRMFGSTEKISELFHFGRREQERQGDQ